MSLHRIQRGSAPREIRWNPSRDGRREIPTLATAAGWRTLDSLHRPVQEAAAELAAEAPGTPLLLLGVGGGAVAEALVRRGPDPVLAVTPFEELEERSARTLEGALPAGPPEVTLLLAASHEQAWGEVERWLAAHPGAVVRRHEREASAWPAFYAPLELRARALLEERPRASAPPQGLRVLLLAGQALLEGELQRALEAAGAEVVVREAPRGRVRAEQALELIEANSPSLVLSVNDLGCDTEGVLPEACAALGIEHATWLLDDPRFLGGPARREAAGRGRGAFCWDRNGLDGWRELGLDRAWPLPLATEPERFQAADPLQGLEGRVVFVGSPRFASAEGFFARLEGDEEAVRLADDLAAEVARTRRPPADDHIREELRARRLEGRFEPEALHRLPAFVVQRANLAYRRLALEALAPLKPVVYGEGWDRLLDPAEFDLRGPVPYENGLAALYRADAVHISLTNLQMRAWPNQRAFDIPAAGSAVLMDHLDGLEELFGDAVLGARFSEPGELRELAARYAGDASLRRDLAHALREVVLDRHTVAHRAGEILARLELGLPEGAPRASGISPPGGADLEG